ncbi:hypothetical protein AHMF7605_23155 [Adhaeribacter arboris]|uniref:Phosphatidate cytidylyltransferase n=1 Tax=Adhaeribacter arboris TaxID=2072846 RepID=A0A2T2YL02_9BACT|nr:hypothetical protein AHMF7605_23155 [Adhaeribacter arboris]
MKNFRYFFPIFLMFLALTVTSCEVIGDIFKAGMWTAVIGIVVVVLFVLWLLRKIRGPRV